MNMGFEVYKFSYLEIMKVLIKAFAMHAASICLLLHCCLLVRLSVFYDIIID